MTSDAAGSPAASRLREEPVAAHKFAAGQSVRFSPSRHEDMGARGVYTIVRTLPEEGNTPQYRIKAKVDGRERIVREDQLARA
jgi:hypothetical protein